MRFFSTLPTSVCGLFFTANLLCLSAFAQTPPSVAARPAATPSAAPQPATIVLQHRQLRVVADNSDLSQILQQVAQSSGMKIIGLQKSERVFGTYGPGNPWDVITKLLTGSGYNFTMVGETSTGTPQTLTLTPRGDQPPTPPSPPSPQMSAPAVSPSPANPRTQPYMQRRYGRAAYSRDQNPDSDPAVRMQQQRMRMLQQEGPQSDSSQQ